MVVLHPSGAKVERFPVFVLSGRQLQGRSFHIFSANFEDTSVNFLLQRLEEYYRRNFKEYFEFVEVIPFSHTSVV